MKRTALVDYDSDDDVVPQKKRKLPSLSSSLVVHAPTDNPALHQGRIRTTPYVEGQFVAHIYVPLILEPHSSLTKLINKAYASAKAIVPALHPIIPSTSTSTNGTEEGDEELSQRSKLTVAFDPKREHEFHISLSRPVFLRAHQRGELKRAVKAISQKHYSFDASFATFLILTNDEKTRTFLTMEIGAGHTELKSLSEALTPVLHSVRQKAFYSEPRFHASFAWALLDHTHTHTHPSSSNPTIIAPHPLTHPSPPLNPLVITTTQIPDSNSTPVPSSPTPNPPSTPSQPFPSLPPSGFPPTLLPTLHPLSSSLPKLSTFTINQIHIKIGKHISKFTLSGLRGR